PPREFLLEALQELDGVVEPPPAVQGAPEDDGVVPLELRHLCRGPNVGGHTALVEHLTDRLGDLAGGPVAAGVGDQGAHCAPPIGGRNGGRLRVGAACDPVTNDGTDRSARPWTTPAVPDSTLR